VKRPGGVRTPGRHLRSGDQNSTSTFPFGITSRTIIFLPDKPTTEALAHHLSHALNLPPGAGAIAEMNALEESVSKDMLITFLSRGVAVHNADLSWGERDIVARSRDNISGPLSTKNSNVAHFA